MSAAIDGKLAGRAPSRPVLIVLEGLDGVGKSTVARALATRLDATLLSTPGADFAPMREELERIFRDTPAARTLFYASTVIRAAEQARVLLDGGKSVVIDRFLLSTLVYSRSPEARSATLRLVGALPVPDLTVYLHAPVDVRAARIGSRPMRTGCDVDSLERDGELDETYQRLLRLPAVGRTSRLDTTTDLPDALAGSIIDEITRGSP